MAGLMQQQTTPASVQANGGSKSDRDLDRKDAAIVAGFKRRGISDVILRDRNNPKAPFNVRSYRGWLEEGGQVRKGEHGIRGLFHISQTDPIAKSKGKAKR